MTQTQPQTGHGIDAEQARTEWLRLLERTRGTNWQRPDTDAYWSADLDTAPAWRLRDLQSEKLRAAARYASAWIPLYRRKFDAIGLEPGDIRSVADLHKIPITTKQDMSEDLAANPPWGSYTAVDDAAWRARGWQIFASSGTTAQARVFRGCTEASPSAGGYTCPAAVRDKSVAATHLMEDTHIWETVNPASLEPVADGQRGLTVVTNLCSEASPQLRFLVGDFTTLDHSPCACGRSHLRAMGGFVGRADDMLNVRGVTLFPSAVEDAVRRVPQIGEEFQIVVSHDARGMDLLTIVAEPRPEVGQFEYPTVARLIEDEIVSRCELRPVIDLLPYGTLPRTEFKAKRVKDLRNEIPA